MKHLRKTKGITLIALVITIIILLILAGVTISQLTNNGLFENSKLAKEKEKEAEDDEKEKLAEYEEKIGNWTRAGGIGSGTTTINGKIFGKELVTEGEGTLNSPFIITNKEQLYILAALVNSGDDFEGKYIKLKNDIELDSTKQWIPIGNENAKFQGTFDGNAHTITGLQVSNSLGNQGLFGVIGEQGVIQKIIVEGNVTAIGNSGCIVGVNNGNVKNCINKAKFNNTATAYGQGGICGTNYGLIFECANLGQIKGSYHVGGITGNNNGIVKECYNLGQVSGKDNIGGIVGMNGFNTPNKGYIYNCYNNAQVSGNYNIGGLIGVAGYGGGLSYLDNSYTVNNTTIYGYGSGNNHKNNYTTNSKDNLQNLNSGIDEVEATESTESPWIADGKKIDENGNVVDDLDENDNKVLINGGYPILKWQKQN